MLHGAIIKGIGGFYYVDTDRGVFECRARGKFRLENITPLIGDYVTIEENESSRQGYIIDIKPRKNQLIRPTVANVDQVIIVFAAKKPDINMLLLQKFLIYAEFKRLSVVVCINKVDLDEQAEYTGVADMLRAIPYRVIETSTKTGKGIEELKEVLSDKVSVFAGPSGAGKSSLLNAVQPGLQLKTGDLSKKIDRGTHTTRHAELIKLCMGGKVADTPGFTSLDINEIEAGELQYCFPEFETYRNCRFPDCMHDREPGCGVKEALEQGLISKIRYTYYISLLNELKSNRRF